MLFVYWLPAIAGALHVTEEFYWPGGFSEWFREYRSENQRSFTRGFAIAVNGVMLLAGVALGWMGPDWPRALSLWLILVAILGANAFLHLIGSWRTRRYVPGLVTGMLVNLPLCLWGYAHFIGNGEASLSMAATSLALGASYDIWSNLSHRARSAWMGGHANGNDR